MDTKKLASELVSMAKELVASPAIRLEFGTNSCSFQSVFRMIYSGSLQDVMNNYRDAVNETEKLSKELLRASGMRPVIGSPVISLLGSAQVFYVTVTMEDTAHFEKEIRTNAKAREYFILNDVPNPFLHHRGR